MTGKQDTRQGLVVALAILLSLITVKTVEKILSPQIGEWGAFGIGVIAAIVVVLIVTKLIYSLWKPFQ